MPHQLFACRLPGRTPYREALEWQRRLARRRIEGTLADDLLLLVEHEPVVTLGRGSSEANVVASTGLLALRGIEAVEIERGGDVTYHGPGQLVGYPILDLRRYRTDLHWYVRRLEEALIQALAELGLDAFRAPGLTGVWVGDQATEDAEPLPHRVASGALRKIASIGVHVSRWVTWHGFALNVTREPLDNFRLVIPCGIEGVRMTSIANEGVDAGVEETGATVCRGFEAAFGTVVRTLDQDALPGLVAERSAAG